MLPNFKPILAAWEDGVAGAPKETPLEVTEPNVNPPVCRLDVVVVAGLPNWKPLLGVDEPKLNPPAWVAGFAPRFKPPVLPGCVPRFKPPVLAGVVPKGTPLMLPGAAAAVVPLEPNEKPIKRQQKEQVLTQEYVWLSTSIYQWYHSLLAE